MWKWILSLFKHKPRPVADVIEVVKPRENKISRKHADFLIQQNAELYQYILELYTELDECEDPERIKMIKDSINVTLKETKRLLNRAKALRKI